MAKFHLGQVDQIEQGSSKVYKFEGKKYLIHRLSDGVFATGATCTHMFVPLTKGVIVSDKTIRCPLHRAEFDIRTGEVEKWANFPPGVQLLDAVRPKKAIGCYEVIEEEGQHYLVV